MYRILLTDDEYLIADGLFEYIHSRRGEVFDVVKAYSAEEGLSVMERMRVDIVVTDIEMPIVNGLSFHETICRKWPRAKIIFLTAHSNFDYVYYASRFPNTRFLLKSDGFAALLSLLDETARQISGELFSRGFLSAEAPGNGGIIPAQMSVMRGLLTAPPEETQPLQKKLDAWYVPLSASQELTPLLLQYRCPAFVSESVSLCGRIREEFEENSTVYPVCLDEKNIFFLFQQKAETALPYPAYLREMLDLLLPPLEKRFSSPLLFVVSREPISWNRLPAVYERMLRTAANYADVHESLVCTVGAGTEKLFEREETAQNLSETALSHVDAFMEEHFREDISLSDIAAHVFLSPSYVSSLYKKRRGINVIDRLQQIRIRESEALLCRTNLKIQDIAGKCGFRSARYFIGVFRKKNGMNPGKYREEKTKL